MHFCKCYPAGSTAGLADRYLRVISLPESKGTRARQLKVVLHGKEKIFSVTANHGLLPLDLLLKQKFTTVAYYGGFAVNCTYPL